MIEEEKQEHSQDDKIVGALAHAAAFMPMWGIIAPVLIWVSQREKSEYIRQQSAQALAWQLLQIGLFFIGMALYMGSFFLTFGSVFMMEEMGSSGPPPAFFLPFCVMGFLFLIFFATIIVAIYAAVRNLQGRDFTYPLIGKRVRAYLAKIISPGGLMESMHWLHKAVLTICNGELSPKLIRHLPKNWLS